MIEEINKSTEFCDLSGRLKAIGIFQIVLGSLSGFFALIMLAAASALKYSDLQRAQLDPKTATTALAIYIIAAVFFIWMGIASIKCQKWVRPVILSLMIPSLIIGAFTFFYMAYAMPLILDITMEATQAKFRTSGINNQVFKTITYIFTMIILFIFYILIPGIHVLVYKSKNIKATCEQKDSQKRWTDNAPTELIGISIWMVLSGLYLFFYSTYGIFPFFGTLITGKTATLLVCFIAVIFIFCGYNIYKKNIIGWSSSIVFIAIMVIASIVTMVKIPLIQIINAINASSSFTPAQLEIVKRTGEIMFYPIVWFSIFTSIAALGFIIYCKKFFDK